MTAGSKAAADNGLRIFGRPTVALLLFCESHSAGVTLILGLVNVSKLAHRVIALLRGRGPFSGACCRGLPHSLQTRLLCGCLVCAGEQFQTGLNRRNIFIDFLGHRAAIANPSLDTERKPLAMQQHCLKGPAIFEPNICIDDLLDALGIDERWCPERDSPVA